MSGVLGFGAMQSISAPARDRSLAVNSARRGYEGSALLASEEWPRRVLSLVATAVLAVLTGLLAATNLPLEIAALVGTGVLAMALVRPSLVLYFLVAAGGLPLNFVTGGDRSLLGGLGGSTVAGVLLVLYVATLVVLLLSHGWLARGVAVFAVPVTWAIWSTFTLVYTDWPDEGIRLAFKIWYPLSVGMLAYFVFIEQRGLRGVRKWWYVGFAISSAIALVLLILDGLPAYVAGGVYRYTSLMHPSPFSFFMLVTFLFAFSLWTQYRRRLDAIVAAAAGLQVVLSATRISIATLVLSLLILGLLNADRPLKALRGLVLAAAVGLVVLGSLIAFPVLQSGVFFRPVSSLSELSDPGNWNTQGRDVDWAAVFNDYKTGDRLSGRGLGSSTRFLLRNQAQLGAGVVHNEYLRVLYEQGLIGLLWFLGMLAIAALYLGRLARRATGVERALLAGACAATVAYATISITDNALDYYNVLAQYVTVLAAAGLALRARRRLVSAEESQGGSTRSVEHGGTLGSASG